MAAKKDTADDSVAALAATELVKMRIEEPAYPGGPTLADVHPDEVENWERGGWVISEVNDGS